MAEDKQGTTSRREFVQRVPMDMKAKEVVRLAKREGITMKEHDVYTLRYQIRKERGETTPRPREPTGGELLVLPTSKERSLMIAARKERFQTLDVEDQLRVLIARVGTMRTIEIARSIEGKLAGI